nr:hypothetical protein [Bacteroides sp.]
MKLINIASAIFMALAAVVPAAAVETEVEFSFARPGATESAWGTNKLENYDVAIRISDPGLAGSQVKGFSCPLATTEDMRNFSGWISKKLTLNDNERNVPDVSATASVDPATNMLTVTFDEPYTITREGVYVGFSFDMVELTQANMKPLIMVSRASEDDLDGFWLHTTRSYHKWRTFDNRKLVAPISVYLVGEFTDNCVAVGNIPTIRTSMGEPFSFNIGLSNFGTAAVNNLDYAYSANNGEFTGGGHIDLDQPIPAQFGSRGEVTIDIDAIDRQGTMPLELTITHVNGELNTSSNASVTSPVTMLSFMPVTRPLMEEYTGLWCGFCPRGFVAMEQMGKKYPGEFVAVSIHSKQRDPMECISEFPSNVSGFPAAVLNRTTLVDPYYGTSSDKELGIEDDWLNLRSQVAIADVEAMLDWEDDTHQRVVCRSYVRFTSDWDGDADFRIAYAVVADGIDHVGDDYDLAQSNYFSGDKYVSGEGWDVFVNGGEKVSGLVFNDVLVAFKDYYGVKGSVPSTIRYGEKYLNSYTYDASFLNLRNVPIVSDFSKIRCVAMVFDGKGNFINCASSGYIGTSGIAEVTPEDGTTVATTYYDLQGRVVANPAHGQLLIRVDRFSDGSTLPVKIVY